MYSMNWYTFTRVPIGDSRVEMLVSIRAAGWQAATLAFETIPGMDAMHEGATVYCEVENGQFFRERF